MLQILPYLYTLIVLSGGIYLTLLGFKIYKPRMKSPEEQEKMNNWHIKFGTFAKYGGIALTLWGVINLTNSDLNPFNFEKHSSRNHCVVAKRSSPE
jgi:small neutral amino acid transporter SnatA (MarC family)